MSKILLLEDDEVLSETLVELLESEAFEVLHVKDGEAALDATFEHKFSLLLLDVNVPLLSGFEVLKSLRESGDTTPAIFLTSLSDVPHWQTVLMLVQMTTLKSLLILMNCLYAFTHF